MYAAISVSGVALYKELCLLVGAWKTASCQNYVPFEKRDCEQSVHQCVCVIGVCPVSLVAVTSTLGRARVWSCDQLVSMYYFLMGYLMASGRMCGSILHIGSV